jgi:hypothetical protein
MDGWSFSGWSGDVSGSANPATITLDANKSVTATFTQIFYTLTITSGTNGSITQPGLGTFTYAQGTVVNLLATANTGYGFDTWMGTTGSVSDINAASTTIVMNGNYNIHPNFAKTYTLTITTKPGGTVTQPGIGTFTFKQGTVVNLLALPQPLGYAFDVWEGNKSTIADEHAASTTITMNGDYVINAKFKTVNVRTLTIISDAHGNVTQPGVGTFSYNEGTIVNLLAVANSGHTFLFWSGDIGHIANVFSASTTLRLQGDCVIRANFSP